MRKYNCISCGQKVIDTRAGDAIISDFCTTCEPKAATTITRGHLLKARDMLLKAQYDPPVVFPIQYPLPQILGEDPVCDDNYLNKGDSQKEGSNGEK